MAGEAHHVDVLAFHINVKRPCRLGRVQYEQQPVITAERPYLLHIQHVSGEIGTVGTDHHLGIGPQQTFKRLIVQPALPVRRDKVHLCPRRPQAVQGPEHGVVVPVGCDHMIPRPQKAVKRSIEGLGGIDGEAHPVRCRATQQRGDLCPHRIDGPGRRKGVGMGPPTAVAKALHRPQHRLGHPRRLGPGGGGIIQIDHGLITFPAVARRSTISYILVTPPTARRSVRP